MADAIRSMFSDIFNTFTLVSVVDIAITAFLIYKIMDWIKDTQAQQVAKGVLIILLLTQLSDWLGLITINYIFKSVITVGFIAIVVMFQPELRRALQKLGSTRFNKMISGLVKADLEIDSRAVIH